MPGMVAEDDCKPIAPQLLTDGEIRQTGDAQPPLGHINERFNGVRHGSARKIDIVSTIPDRPALQLSTRRISVMQAGVPAQIGGIPGPAMSRDIVR